MERNKKRIFTNGIIFGSYYLMSIKMMLCGGLDGVHFLCQFKDYKMGVEE